MDPTAVIVARRKMARAVTRLNGVSAALGRSGTTEGEFDNHSDGVDSAILHIVDAVETVRTGADRRASDEQRMTVIRSVVLTLTEAGITGVPATKRLSRLDSRRNQSVHSDRAETLDRDGLGDAVAAAWQLHRAAATYIERQGVSLKT